MKTSSERYNRIVYFAAVAIGATVLLGLPETRELLKAKEFYIALIFTLLRAFIAFICSFSLAFALTMLSQNKWVRLLVSPIVTFLRSLPTMAVVLLLIIKFSANTTTIIVGMLVLFPTFYASLLPVFLGIDKELYEVASVFGANARQRFLYVTLPSMLPATRENAVAGLSLSVKLIVSSEVLAQTAKSIGMMMNRARSYLRLDRLFVLTAVVVIICMFIDAAGLRDKV